MIPQDDELLQDFVAECREHLADIETQLLALEAGNGAVPTELVDRIFRAAHSIKGGAGLLNLSTLKTLAHRTETALGQVRSGDLLPTPEVINILLLAFDRLRDLVNDIKASDQADVSDISVALTGLASSSLSPADKHTLNQSVEVPVPEQQPRNSVRASMLELDRAKRSRQAVYLLEYDLPDSTSDAKGSPLSLLGNLGKQGTILDCTVAPDSAGASGLHVLFASALDEAAIQRLSPEPIRAIRHLDAPQGSAARNDDIPPAAPHTPAVVAPTPPPPSGASASDHPAQAPRAPDDHANAAKPVQDSTLRVNVVLLESLMNLAGDLVLSRNELNDAIARGDLDAIRAGSQRMSLVTSDLQQAIVQTRLQPIGNLLSKFKRIVRDLAHSLNKEVQLHIDGSEVELDKAILEGLSDPLIHMVRNAVDHGIEAPDDRRSRGKSIVGTLSIRVQHEAGQVVVEIEDDGRGLDARAIAAAAVARGVVTREQLAGMTHAEMLALIFVPGVSTAERVTDISGRGVGMDVVKSNLDRLSAKVEIESEVGVGTLFRFKLPLTLAIIPSLLVSVGDERFAIPQVNLVELLRIPAAQAKQRFERIGEAEVLVLRGELIPLLHLGDVLGIQRWYADPASGQRRPDRRARLADRRSPRVDASTMQLIPSEPPPGVSRRSSEDRRFRAASDVNIAIVSAGHFRYGLAVDELHDTLEIVVKPLGRHLKRLREYAGATILGDGAVALIVDIYGLAEKAGLAALAETARARELARDKQRAKQGESLALLSFFQSGREHCAVPLAQVKRVEHVDLSDIERLGGRRTMRYRSSSLPLVALHDVASVGDVESVEGLAVVVFETRGREVGLLAGRPIDAVDVPATVDRETHRQRGILGSTIVRDETTLIVDLGDLVDAAFPEWSAGHRAGPPAGARAPTVLLAEDSDFFRGQVRKCIEGGGYGVLAAEDGQAAWELLEQHQDSIALVVTDIEMPRMNGLQLTRRVRADGRFQALPVVALSSLAGEDDIARGMAAGVTEYLVKLDGERLLEAIRGLLGKSSAARA